MAPVVYTGFLALVQPASTAIPNWQCAIGGLVFGAFSLLFCIFLTYLVMRQWAGTKSMQEISGYIQEGAVGFLTAEYLALGVYVLFVAAGLGFASFGQWNFWQVMVCFIIGCVSSAICGWLGMVIATKANVRTCAAAINYEDAIKLDTEGKAVHDKNTHGMNAALRVAFNSGSVMGLSVVGLGLLVLSATFLAFPDFDILAGFGFGGSSIALFARVGGGIFTKAADVGSDLVGKVEAGIPEDDARNPGTIADNVGDNVGDVAGMGADLFGSFAESIIAAGALGTTAVPAGSYTSSTLIALPFWIASAGIVASIIGVLAVRLPSEDVPKEKSQDVLLRAIRIGTAIAALVVAGLTVACVHVLGITYRVWGCIMIGLVGGIGIGYSTEYATSFAYDPVKQIARAGNTGPATVVLEGLAVGMWSAVPPLLIIVTIVITCIYLAGMYGVAIAAVGMLSTLGVTLATDAYGPVADHAGGIAEMTPELEDYVRERTDALDALGNTTAATGKGFAIGSAVLTAISLMVAYTQAVGVTQIDLIADIMVIPGLLLGAMLPFIFSSLTMLAVGRAAMEMVEEIRRQFRETPGLREGVPGVKADHARCVAISTRAALRQMIIPGLFPVVAPICVGLILGSKALAGLLIGAIITAFMLAVTMANAGGAWDNAKKLVEAGGIEGEKKGSQLHKATVVGDTIGDPFKDTSGPALNILIKMMAVLSLMLAPAFNQAWPFMQPNWWAGVIILAGSAIITVIYLRWLRAQEEKNKAILMAAAIKAAREREMQEKFTVAVDSDSPAGTPTVDTPLVVGGDIHRHDDTQV
jgi:K(+)-stimulated pyrophosphate-energized sodium pump